MFILLIVLKVNKIKIKKFDFLINKMLKLGLIFSDDRFVCLFIVDIFFFLCIKWKEKFRYYKILICKNVNFVIWL